jgi:hypothetical protein
MMRRYHAAPGLEPHEIDNGGITFDEVREGCWSPIARLADMDINGPPRMNVGRFRDRSSDDVHVAGRVRSAQV